MPAQLYSCETILKRLAQDLEDMAAVPGEFIQKAHAMVGQQHFPRHRHVAATDQPHICDGMMGSATPAGRDRRREVASEAGDNTGMTTSRPSECNVRDAHRPAAYVLNERRYFS